MLEGAEGTNALAPHRQKMLNIANQITVFIITWGVFSIYPIPHDMPIWGSTILLSSVSMGYHTVYRLSHSGTIQAQFAAAY